MAGAQVWHYVYSRGLLFLAQPRMHELLARCSSADIAAELVAQDAARRAGVEGQAPVVIWEDLDAHD